MLVVETKSITNSSSQQIDPYDFMYVEKLLKFCQIVMNKQEMTEFIINEKFAQCSFDNAEVHRRFYSGQERGSDWDGIWEAEINIYYDPGTVIGYTNKGSTVININTYTIPMTSRDKDIANRVGNLVHEYCHLVGMTHSPSWQWWRKKSMRRSAPYKIGSMAKRIARNLLEMEEVKWTDL